MKGILLTFCPFFIVAYKSKAQTEICEQEQIKVPQFRRGKKESERAYLRRMSQETQHVLFLTKNQPERHPEQMLEEKPKTSNKNLKKKKLVAYWFVV